jgi:hypothetical protein
MRVELPEAAQGRCFQHAFRFSFHAFQRRQGREIRRPVIRGLYGRDWQSAISS